MADGLTKEEALHKLHAQEALIAIVVPSPADGESNGNEAVTVYVDDSDPVRVDPALSKLESLYWRKVAEGNVAPPPEARIERLYNRRAATTGS